MHERIVPRLKAPLPRTVPRAKLVQALKAPSPQPPKTAAADAVAASAHERHGATKSRDEGKAETVQALKAQSPQPPKTAAAGRVETAAEQQRGGEEDAARLPHTHHYVIPAPDVGPPIGVCRGCGDEKLHNNVFEFEETPLRGGDRSRKGLDRLFEAVAEASVEVFDPSTDTQGEPFDLDSAGGALDPTFGADVIGAELDSSVGDASQGSPADDSNRGDVPDAAKAGPEPGLKVFAPRPGRERW